MNYIKLLIISAVLGFTSMACAKDQFNVLLFTAGDLHAESLESYPSHVKGLTPQLDKFADPMLEAFRNSDDRTIVDKVIRDMYSNTNA